MNLRRLNRILLQTLWSPVAALLLMSAVLVWQVLDAERTVSQIQLADSNIAALSEVSALLVDEESALRGYQTTSNEIFLQPYLYARDPLDSRFQQLRAGMLAQGGASGPVDLLIEEHRRWLRTIAQPLVHDVQSGVDTRGTGLNLRGKGQMDAIRAVLRGLAADQRARQMQEVERWRSLVRHTLEIVVGLAVVVGLLLGAFTRSRLHLILGAFEATLAGLRRHSRATEASELRLRTTLASIGDGVVVCDPQGRVELLNPIAEQLTGWSQSEAFHQPVHKVVQLAGESTRDTLPSPALQAMDIGRPTGPSTSALLCRRDGSVLSVDARGAPLGSREHTPEGAVMVIRDVTEQRRTQSALLASEKHAVAGRVAATIAHEIHNPLDSVVNLLYLLQNGAPAEDAAQFLTMARSELDRVSQISRAMLGMYREARNPIKLDLRALLGDVTLLLNHQMLNAGVTLKTAFDDDIGVTGFPVEIRQVFTNLLSNAIEASPRGGTIVLSARRDRGLKGRAGVLVGIEDCGYGIDAASLPHLFEPFFTTKGEKGTGLGLWVSQGLVLKHGGTINVRSSAAPDNHATTFSVFLPSELEGAHSASVAPAQEQTPSPARS